jgi:Ca-activated chloride channel homolog
MILASLAVFHFLRPVWLLALLPALALWWRLRIKTDSLLPWRKVIAPHLLVHLVLPGDGGSWVRPVDELLAVWIVAALAAAGPSWALAPSPFAQDAPPVMILVKVTPSMLKTDVAPNRLARAQEKISDLLKLMPSQSAGLIAYSGSAHLVLPPTHDGSIVDGMAQALAPDEMPVEGDDLSGALSLARHVLADDGSGGSLLVLADDTAVDEIRKFAGLKISGTPIIVLNLRRHGATVPSALRQAATTLGAGLIAASIDNSDVARIARRLAAPGRVVTTPGENQHWQDMGWYLSPLLAMLILVWFRRGWEVLP